MAEALSKNSLHLCLEELCRLYKLPGALKTLDLIYPKSGKPITLDKFINIAKKINFETSLSELSLKDSDAQKSPIIIFNKKDEASLLLASDNNQYHVWEASSNQVTKITAQIFKTTYEKKCILIKPQVKHDGRVSFHEHIIKPSGWFWESLTSPGLVSICLIFKSGKYPCKS